MRAASPSRSRGLVLAVITGLVAAAIATLLFVPRSTPAIDRILNMSESVVAFGLAGLLVAELMRRTAIDGLRAIILMASLVYGIGLVAHPILTVLFAQATGQALCFNLGSPTLFCPTGTPSSIPGDVLGSLTWFYGNTLIALALYFPFLFVIVPASAFWYALLRRRRRTPPSAPP